MAKATPLRSGDALAGLAAESGEERVAAQFALADVPLKTFLGQAVVPYEDDEVTRLIVDSHDKDAFATVSHLTVGGLRDWLLSDDPTTEALAALAPGVTPEMAAAVAKISRLQDLMVMRGEMLGGDQIPQHHRPARPPVDAAATQPPDRRSARHRGQHSRRAAARLRRRRHRHQSGNRQRAARACAAHGARRPSGRSSTSRRRPACWRMSRPRSD